MTSDMSSGATKPPFYTTVPGAVTIIGLLGLVTLFVWLGDRDNRARAEQMSVAVSSCDLSGPTGKVVLEVRNTGPTTRSAHIQIEYLDADGVRIDTDSATAWNVPAGGTVKVEETTSLDAPAPGGTCEITSVR
ncbi:FxLYD domain-containing protein [Asanoa sp. NPDC050611]|uniref:FxLYD domain-containing protein n=1 Tax=Asanoa sp. NPDC050611 TaxID=3157098 RepID=UPI0033E7F86C